MARILHIIDTLSGAGPTRSLRASVQYLDAIGQDHQHAVLTLRRQSFPPALVRIRQVGIELHQAPEPDAARELIEAADIVQLHFWLNPWFARWLAEDWPPMRRLTWFKILGRHAPQVITPELLEANDAVMVTSPLSLELPAFREARLGEGRVEVVPGMVEADRLESIAPRPHDRFNISYIGTANPTKMHPEFVAMSAAAQIPDARFIVCGAGDLESLRSEAARLGAEERFELRGYVENIRPVLETSDVFGYPLVEETYAASERSLQEAMLAGVPPVVFPHGGVAAIVEHGVSGLVVHTPAEYSEALERLRRDPEERARLGARARQHIQQSFDGREIAGRIASLYDRLMLQPKRAIPPLHPDGRPAERYARWLGEAAPCFEASLGAASDAEAWAADSAIAASSTLQVKGEGGLVQFRNADPDDPVLLGWSGLALAGAGRWTEALAELERACALAPQDRRLARYRGVALERTRGHAAELFPL